MDLSLSLCRTSWVSTCARVVWLIGVGLFAFCTFNYSRAWWQELVSALSPIGVLVLIVALPFEVRRLRRRLSIIGCLVVLVQLACVTKVALLIRPYLSYSKRSVVERWTDQPLRVLFVDELHEGSERPRILERLDAFKPNVFVILRGRDATPLRGIHSDTLPFSLVSTGEGERMVELYSLFAPLPASLQELGFGARPAVFGVLDIGSGKTVELGALDLLPSFSEGAFLSSRVTARRLATLARYSKQPRIALGAFRATEVSQIVQMYAGQVRMRSVFFNQGLSGVASILVSCFTLKENLSAFTSRSMDVSHVKRFYRGRDGFSGIEFEARVPN